MNIKKYHHLLRIAASFAALTFPLSCLFAQTTTPPADVTITGVGTDVDFGWSVAPAGDVNGDGITDLVVGDPSNSSVAQFAGRAYLFLGPLTANIDTSKAVATISAEAFGDNLGFSVASAGDVTRRGNFRGAQAASAASLLVLAACRNNLRPTVYIIAGCNGAGKRTFAKQFLPSIAVISL